MLAAIFLVEAHHCETFFLWFRLSLKVMRRNDDDNVDSDFCRP